MGEREGERERERARLKEETLTRNSSREVIDEVAKAESRGFGPYLCAGDCWISGRVISEIRKWAFLIVSFPYISYLGVELIAFKT